MDECGSSDTDSEVEKLLSDQSTDMTTAEKEYRSKSKQRGMLFTVLCLQFLSLCADTSIFPFFPSVAGVKGLTTTQMGFVFSCYELSRCIFSPIFGSLVRVLKHTAAIKILVVLS